MSKILAGYILAVAAAYDAAYDVETSNAAVEASRVRAREKVQRENEERAERTARIADVTAQEMLNRTVYVDGEKHTVSIQSEDGKQFVTDQNFIGDVKYVRRRGRGYVFDLSTQETQAEQERVEVSIDELIDYAKFQGKTIYECATEIVPHLYRQPVYLLLQTAWNDALGWANAVMALRDADGEDVHDFRFLIPSAAKDGSDIDFQLSAQDELSAAFKLGQIFHENLSIETVKIHNE